MNKILGKIGLGIGGIVAIILTVSFIAGVCNIMYFYYKLCLKRTILPFIAIFLFVLPVVLVEPHLSSFGQNTGLGEMSLTVFSLLYLGSIVLFIGAKIRMAVASEERKEEIKGQYFSELYYPKTTYFVMIFFFTFLLTSLAPASALNGAWRDVIVPFWSISLLVTIFGLWLIGVFFWMNIFEDAEATFDNLLDKKTIEDFQKPHRKPFS